MAEQTVDQVARDKASDATHAIANFRAVTEVELRLINTKIETTHNETNEKIDKIESAIKWAGGLIVSLMLTVLGWAVVQQLNANEATKKDMSQQIKILEQQEAARAATRAEILSRLPEPRTAEAADTADRLGQAGDLRDMRPNNRGKD